MQNIFFFCNCIRSFFTDHDTICYISASVISMTIVTLQYYVVNPYVIISMYIQMNKIMNIGYVFRNELRKKGNCTYVQIYTQIYPLSPTRVNTYANIHIVTSI